MARVLKEIEEFWNNQDSYKTLGITHKRGILLYGPPGCGKSGILNAIINVAIQSNGIVIELTDLVDHYADAIPWLRQIEADRLVVTIIEDIDDLANQYEEDLLEIMDGHTSLGCGMLYIATTNDLEKVPDRIRNRPSRIDTLIEVPPPDFALRLEYLSKLLGKIVNLPETQLEEYATKTDGMSLADLKELVISLTVYKKDFDTTIARLRRTNT
jgi:AAA family ATPase